MVDGIQKSKEKAELLDRLGLTAYLLWHLWKAQNSWIFNVEFSDERDIVQRAWSEWIEYKAAQQEDQHAK